MTRIERLEKLVLDVVRERGDELLLHTLEKRLEAFWEFEMEQTRQRVVRGYYRRMEKECQRPPRSPQEQSQQRKKEHEREKEAQAAREEQRRRERLVLLPKPDAQ